MEEVGGFRIPYIVDIIGTLQQGAIFSTMQTGIGKFMSGS